MIKVEKIEKQFGDAYVLRDISFDIHRGEYISIMGSSGSGKSTLLYSISGMDSINSGRILYDEKNICDMQEEELSNFRLRKMGFVFQNSQMLKNLTILDNIILPGLVAKMESAELIRKRARKLMERMGIEDLGGRDIRNVSGGQLQRASICRAMINQPEILFLDEPTGALNSAATKQILTILDELNQSGTTILIVTHDSEVAASAKKILYIMDGQLAAMKKFGEGEDKGNEVRKIVREYEVKL